MHIKLGRSHYAFYSIQIHLISLYHLFGTAASGASMVLFFQHSIMFESPAVINSNLVL